MALEQYLVGGRDQMEVDRVPLGLYLLYVSDIQLLISLLTNHSRMYVTQYPRVTLGLVFSADDLT
jgi:hypothetical protein